MFASFCLAQPTWRAAQRCPARQSTTAGATTAAAAVGNRQRTTKTYRLRRARVEDAPAVSQIMAEVFGSGHFTGSGIEDSALIVELEAAYAAAVSREGDIKLADALLKKEQATLAARAYRMNQEAALLRAQLAMAKGQPAVWPTEGPNELRQLSKWQRMRKFVCLVVEEVEETGSSSSSSAIGSGGSSSTLHSTGPSQGYISHSSVFGSIHDDYGFSSHEWPSGRLVATATLNMLQAEAALPPPFPSSAPMRAYISNMAVVPSARRRGLGKALCSACGRIAKAWGEPCVLLHVAADNTAAQQLYQDCGFVTVSNSRGFSGLIKGPWTQQRMVTHAADLASTYVQLPVSASSSSHRYTQQQPQQQQQVQA